MGVELELEGFGSRSQREAAAFLAPAWSVTADGSLRNGGVEFVTTGGLGGVALHAALERMEQLLANVNYDASFRCSTHMHINMLDFNFNQIARFLLAYATCEPVLFAFCGEHRRSSNFCVPVVESLPFHKKLISRLYDDAIIGRAQSGQACNKYTAMNFLPLFDGGRDRSPLGTVEFRGGRPLTTLSDMLTQANLLLAIKEYVRTHSDGTDDEFLSAITMHGAMNTVYSSGIASAIPVDSSAMDDAVVTAWCLLKSYQNGKRQRSEARASREQRLFGSGGVEEVSADDPLTSERRSGLRWVSIDQGLLPSGIFNGGYKKANGGSVWTTERLPWSLQQWPKLHAYSGFLQETSAASSPRGVCQVLVEILTDPRSVVRLTYSEAQKAVAFFMISMHPAMGRHHMIDFLLRVGEMKRLGITQEVTRTGETITFTGGLQGAEWSSVLNSNQWIEINQIVWDLGVENLHELDPQAALWFFLLETKVRAKARVELVQAVERRTGVQLPGIPREISAVSLMSILRAGGVPSQSHVHRDDLAIYDKVSKICDIMGACRLSVPVEKLALHTHTPNIRLVSPLTYTYGFAVETTERRTARVSNTTGLNVY